MLGVISPLHLPSEGSHLPVRGDVGQRTPMGDSITQPPLPPGLNIDSSEHSPATPRGVRGECVALRRILGTTPRQETRERERSDPEH